MRMGLGLGLAGGTADPSAAYALYLNFKTSLYRSGTTKSSAISAMPGYTYTRSGAKSELNGTSAPIAFAANAPGIVPGIGYWSRTALTNYALQSQTISTLGSWQYNNCSVTADQAVAPDGTTTADKWLPIASSTASHAYQNVGTLGAVTVTQSIFAKANGFNWFIIRDQSTVGVGAWFDLANGVVGTVTGGFTASITSVGSGWYRCTIVYTATNTTIYVACAGVDANGSTQSTINGSNGVYLWQAQCLVGNLPDGGPIIVTTTATASIGADVLSTTQTKPTGAFVIYGKASLAVTKGATSTLFYWSDGTASNVVSAQLSASNLVTFTVTNATVNTPVTGEGGTPTGARTVTYALRFNGSTWRGFINGAVMGAESAAAAIPAGTQMNEGHALGASQLNDLLVAGPHIIEAAKTDAEVIALMNAL